MTSDDDWTSAGSNSSDTTISELLRPSQDKGSNSVADGIDVLDYAFPLDGDGLDSIMDILSLPSCSQSPVTGSQSPERNPSNQ